MTLTINGQSRIFDGALTVADLVTRLGLTGKPVAVEVNQRLVRAAERGGQSLAEGDQIEIVTLVGGG